MERLQPMIVIVGPTGSGKSELALRVAMQYGGETVNCDSLQIYRLFNIGTAKLTREERRGITHHLIDIIDPTETFTAGDYMERGRKIVTEIAGRGKVPIVVGGTGFYLRALLEGLFPGPRRNEELRSALSEREKKRPGSVHRILNRLDPVAAARIHPNDRNKTIRALEVRLLERKPMSQLFAKGREALKGFAPVKIGLNPPRQALYERLDARTARMFDRGLIEEVRQILAKGVPPHVKPFAALGYRQALQVVENGSTREDAVASTQLETRQYAKRQMIWFRREKDVAWFDGFGDDTAVQDAVQRRLDTQFQSNKG